MILRDPVHGLIGFEADEYRVIPELLETREVQRLRRVRQLGMTAFVYPGADHTRFSHAVGTAYVMTRFVRRLQQIHGDLPYWQRFSSERARDAVAAALLHDLGHGPFSHLFEEALPNSVRHETWSRRIVLDESSEVHQVLHRADPALPARVADLMVGRSELGYIGHLLSGAFDVDRCDYLPRDAHFTGVSYGRVDLDWLLRSLRFGDTKDANQAPLLAIDGSKGLPAIESFILARLFMFEQVYFHKASRSSEWLLSRILGRASELLRNGQRLEAVPPALADLCLHGDTSLDRYLGLDDTALWHAITAWCDAKDAPLRDLCKRLQARKLFKTLRFYGSHGDPFAHTAATEVARELCKARGLDPNLYVGLDRAVLVPFDEASDGLKVIFPNGQSYNPGDVSFVLGRLRGERLERIRLIFPPEIRDDLLKKVDALGGVPR